MTDAKSISYATKQDILQTDKWNNRLTRMIWILFGVLFSFEALIAAFYCSGIAFQDRYSTQEYLIQFFIVPFTIVLTSMLAAQQCYKKLQSRCSSKVQSRFILCTLIVIVSEVVAVHCSISVIYALYVLPIVVSIIYVDYTTLTMTYVLCMTTYLLVFFGYINIFVQQETHGYLDVLGTIVTLTVTYALSRMVLSRVLELINTAVDLSITQAALTREVSLDSLTQLYNHATFYERLDDCIIHYQKTGEPFSLSIIDIDNFKNVNDTYGHDTGNVVILKLVEIIKDALGEGDLAFRYGGEEFAILTPHTGTSYELAEKIRITFGEYSFPGIADHITISTGLATFHSSYGGRREFFSAADKALYKAKHQGKNQVCFAAD